MDWKQRAETIKRDFDRDGYGLKPHRPSDVIGFSQGITDYGDEDSAAEMLMIVAPGDLLVHHSLTIHRADSNPSDRSRTALGFVFYAGRSVEDSQRRDAYRKELADRCERRRGNCDGPPPKDLLRALGQRTYTARPAKAVRIIHLARFMMSLHGAIVAAASGCV